MRLTNEVSQAHQRICLYNVPKERAIKQPHSIGTGDIAMSDPSRSTEGIRVANSQPVSTVESESISASPSGLKTEQFMGMAVRIHNPNVKPMIPLNDIAEVIGYDRSTLRKLMNRNIKVLEEEVGKAVMDSPQGPQENIVISYAGTLSLLSKIDYLRIKNKDKSNKIIAFQKWVKSSLVEKMQVQAKLPVHEDAHPSGTVNEVMSRYMESARTAAREMGVPLDLAMAKALVLAGRDLHMDLTGYSRLLPAATTASTHPPAQLPAGVFVSDGYLSASEIAQRMNARNGGELRGKDINKFLKNYGLLYKNEEGRWCMTDLGAQYGRIFPFAASSGHVDYFIRWKPEVMQVSGMIRSD